MSHSPKLCPIFIKPEKQNMSVIISFDILLLWELLYFKDLKLYRIDACLKFTGDWRSNAQQEQERFLKKKW